VTFLWPRRVTAVWPAKYETTHRFLFVISKEK
jgi:hypothetical protein